MKIGIDIQSTFGPKTGLGSYTENLTKQLIKIAPQNEYVLFYANPTRDLRTYERMFWDQVGLPWRAAYQNIDLLHCTGYSAPVIRRGGVILTLHDIITVHLPRNVSRTSSFYWKYFLPFTVKYVNRIVTDSEYSKQDIINQLKIPSTKIEVVYPGLDERYRIINEIDKIDRVRVKYQVPHKYILFVSSIEPRKNIVSLIKAFYQFYRCNQTYHLVIVGKKNPHYQELASLIRQLELTSRVIFTGYVPDEDLPYLYNAADLFVFPSLYEGFGLTPLEAMACGVPVICSNRTSLPEVVGDAALLIDPMDIDNLSFLIEKVISNQDLRLGLRTRGLARSRIFNYRYTAEKMVEIYRQI